MLETSRRYDDRRIRFSPAAPVAMLLALGCLTFEACSTVYQPQRSGRIAVVIRGGGAMYLKDGREVPIGPLGGDLTTLVANSPTAAAAAGRSHTQLTVGVPAYVGGLVAVVTGLALSGPVGWVVLGVGAASAGTGLSFMGAGFTNAVDAVNRHNDDMVR